MTKKELEEARKEYLKEIENVIVSVTFEHLQQLYEMGKERVKRQHAPARSQLNKMKHSRFEISAEDFLRFAEICLSGERKI